MVHWRTNRRTKPSTPHHSTSRLGALGTVITDFTQISNAGKLKLSTSSPTDRFYKDLWILKVIIDLGET